MVLAESYESAMTHQTQMLFKIKELHKKINHC